MPIVLADDSLPPVVTTPVVSPSTPAASATLTVNAIATDDVSVASAEANVDGGPWVAMTTSTGVFGDPSVGLSADIGVSAVLEIAAGADHGCALMADTTVWCWGYNWAGELGDGTTTRRLSPVHVAGLAGVRAIAAGGTETCALLADTTVRCWGSNSFGQLGDGTTTNRPTPVAVSGLTGAAEISVGLEGACALMADASVDCWGYAGATNHLTPTTIAGLTDAITIAVGSGYACALLADTTIRCWGSNSYGQLGDGTTTTRLTPVTVSGVSGATDLAASESSTCVVLADSTARCWGNNNFGQLGDGTRTTRLTPVAVSGLSGVTALGSGYYHTCALLIGTTVECWGYDELGQLGDGTGIASPRTTPVEVQGLSGVDGLAAGSLSTCAHLADSTVTCWGQDQQGELGDGTTGDPTTHTRLNPVAVAFDGIGHTVCVRATDGSANVSDGLACTSVAVDAIPPSVISFGPSTPTTKLASIDYDLEFSEPVTGLATDDFTCAGSAGDWTASTISGTGAGPYTVTFSSTNSAVGSLTCSVNRAAVVDISGNPAPVRTVPAAAGVVIDRSGPTVALSFLDSPFWANATSWTIIATWSEPVTGFDQSSVSATNGTVSAFTAQTSRRYSWTVNRIGDGTVGTTVAAGAATDLAGNVSGPGATKTWILAGSPPPSVTDPVLSSSTTAPSATVTVTASATDDVAVTSAQTSVDGGPWLPMSAGVSSFGEPAVGVTANVGGSGAAAISAGFQHTCAVLENATVRCWGYNPDGELGDGTTTDRNTPVTVAGLSGVTAIAADSNFTCALLSDTTVRCWGNNGNGQLGDGTTQSRLAPVGVTGLSGVVALAAGSGHVCAVLVDTTVECWGSNTNGQLGDGTTASRSTPAPVHGLSGVTAISAGIFQTCALVDDGTVRCWGYNDWGQLGDGTMVDRTTPVSVRGLSGVTAIAADRLMTCAILEDTTVKCWGLDRYGSMGNGTDYELEAAVTPAAVSDLSGVVSISAGADMGCAILTDATVRCWGNNSVGQLGDGTTANRLTPVAVSGLVGVQQISSGAYHTCVILTDETARCWGYNLYGELGAGLTSDFEVTSKAVVGVGGTGNGLSAGDHLICVRAADSSANVSDGTECTTLTIAPTGAPTAPSGIIAAAGPESAAVSWVPPAFDGGSPILSFEVSAGPSGPNVTVNGGQTSATIDGLADDTAYSFTVTATNAVGTSVPSTASDAVTPRAGAFVPTTVVENLAAAGTVTTDPGAAGPSASQPVTVAVTIPSPGSVGIAVGGITEAAPAGFTFLGQQVVVHAADATVESPITLTFAIGSTLVGTLPLGSITVYRTEDAGPTVPVPDCAGAPGSASPDPCISNRALIGGDVTVTVLTSSASTWNLAVAAPPLVTIDAVSRPYVGANGSSVVSWHANENGSYAVRRGGTDCSTGTRLASGSYTHAPTVATTTIQASDLALGSNSIRVCLTDGAHMTGSASTTIVRDATAPKVNTILLGGPSPTNAESVSWLVTFSEPVTGVGTGNFTLIKVGVGGTPRLTAVSGGGAIWTVTADSGSGDWTLQVALTNRAGIVDLAGNPLANTLAGKSYQVDRAAPAINVSKPSQGAAYALGSSNPVSFSCVDEALGTGIASCTGTTANGVRVDTNTIGPKSFTVVAIDRAGNSTTRIVSYSVIYTFTGYTGSVANPPTVNAVKAGASVALVFSLGGNRGLSILQGTPVYQTINCSTHAPTGPATATSGTLSYNVGTGRYTYAWQTSTTWSNTCRQVTIVLDDGTSHSAFFKFTK